MLKGQVRSGDVRYAQGSWLRFSGRQGQRICAEKDTVLSRKSGNLPASQTF